MAGRLKDVRKMTERRKKSSTMQILFFTRLILYITAFVLPVIHPSIAVPYDRMGWFMWFFLVPGEMFISYYLAPPKFKLLTWISAAAGYLLLSVIASSIFSTFNLMFIVAGALAFIATALIFKTGGKGYAVAVVEPFLLGFLYYKMLCFSRASEAIARESWGITRLIIILIGCAFLLHGMVLYFSAYFRKGQTGILKEMWLLPIILLPILFIFAVVLPPDFVKNAVVFNLLKPPPRPRPYPLDEWGSGVERGNLLGRNYLEDSWRYGVPRGFDQDGNLEGEGESGFEEGGMLEGVPAEAWYNQKMGQGGENRQYAVMVVASSREPVYAAGNYFDHLDPVRGFTMSEDEPLNELTYMHLIETWQDRSPLSDLGRQPQSIYYISTLPERMLAYRPFRIEPSVLNKKFHPFDFSYNSTSLVSTTELMDWLRVPELSKEEKVSLKKYLEVPLSGDIRKAFETYLNSALKEGRSGYFERVLAIFLSFSSFYYEIGFDDDVSTAKMADFLTRKKRGDCTEFSNSAAILARMVGVPSRVVTGYLASKNLQTLAHRKAVRILQEVIEPLKAFPIQDLYLVTTAHHHSWVQLYLPGYGWIDFDPTSFAIPPLGLGNPNRMNVVIPLIRIEEVKPVFHFPWLFVLQGFVIILLALLVGLYIYRYGMELHLSRLSKGKSPWSLRALYTLILMKLAANGYDLKAPSETPMEYSKRYPELSKFASIYTMLRYREHYKHGERASLFDEIRTAYREVSNICRRGGLQNTLRRAFSLKGLYYRW